MLEWKAFEVQCNEISDNILNNINKVNIKLIYYFYLYKYI